MCVCVLFAREFAIRKSGSSQSEALNIIWNYNSHTRRRKTLRSKRERERESVVFPTAVCKFTHRHIGCSRGPAWIGLVSC